MRPPPRNTIWPASSPGRAGLWPAPGTMAVRRPIRCSRLRSPASFSGRDPNAGKCSVRSRGATCAGHLGGAVFVTSRGYWSLGASRSGTASTSAAISGVAGRRPGRVAYRRRRARAVRDDDPEPVLQAGHVAAVDPPAAPDRVTVQQHDGRARTEHPITDRGPPRRSPRSGRGPGPGRATAQAHDRHTIPQAHDVAQPDLRHRRVLRVLARPPVQADGTLRNAALLLALSW